MIRRLLTWLRKLWPRRIRKTPRKLGWRNQIGASHRTNRSHAKNTARRRARASRQRNRHCKTGGGW